MVHSGYEASAVHDNFSTLRGFIATVKATLLLTAIPTRTRCSMLEEPVKPVHAPAGLVQIESRTTERRARRGRSLS